MITIRRAEAQDMDRICALNDVVQRLHADHRPDLYRWPAEPEGRRALLEKARVEAAWRLLVADEAGGVVGYLATELIDKPAHALRVAHTEGHIHHISVDAGCRERGVGRALVAAGVAELRGQQADRITVGYWAFNTPSRGLFAASGFQPATVTAELVG